MPMIAKAAASAWPLVCASGNPIVQATARCRARVIAVRIHCHRACLLLSLASLSISPRRHSDSSRSHHATMMMMHMTYYNSAEVTLLLNSWTTGGDQSYYAICTPQRITPALVCTRDASVRHGSWRARRTLCPLWPSNLVCSSHRHPHHILPLRVLFRLC